MKRLRCSFAARVALGGFAFAMAVRTAGGQTYRVELLSTFPGYCWALCIQGSYAYVGEGINIFPYNIPNLRILDVSNPASPVQRGMYSPLPAAAEGVYVSGGLAYIAVGTSGLYILDVSNPSSPKFVGSCDTVDNEAGATDICVSGTVAYLPDWTSGLQVIDVSNPSAPSIISSYDTPDIATRLCVSGNLVYLADSLSGIQIIDVTNRANPTLRGSYDTPVSAEGVFVSENIAYVADWTGGVLILDVSNPASPKRLGSCATGPSAANLVVSEGLAYVACWEGGLKAIDVSNPAVPKIVASYDTPGRAVRVAVFGEVVYLTDSTGGFHIFRVRLVDITAPVITLLGDSPIALEVGTPYAEPGYTATDNFDGDVTANVVVTGLPDTGVLGTYIVRYNVKDAAGNPAKEKSRVVFVQDTTSPVITLLGDNRMTMVAGTPYAEPGYTASDNYDGDISAGVAVTGSVDHTLPASYTLHYNVTDSSGNPAAEQTRTVNVIDVPPIITLLGETIMNIEVGTPYVEPGYKALDNLDGDITANVVVTGKVNQDLLGTDILHYNVSDSRGNPAQEVTRTVNIVDTTAPVITLLGDNPMRLEVGNQYVEPGYSATDNYDGDISADVAVTGSVDHNVVGTYTLQYNVSDSSGNPGQTSRTVKVVETTPPVITLLGAEVVTLDVGTPYLEPGYTATDNHDGDITANVVVSGSVDHTIVGTYMLRYNVSDWSGNPADEKTRTVKVMEPRPFEVAEIVLPEAGQVRLTWTSRSGESYGVSFRHDLLTGTWTELTTISSQGDTTSWSDPDVACPCKFYRIERK